MKQHIKAIHLVMETVVKVFNLGFFAVSAVLWLFLAVRSLAAHSYDLGAVWAAFNQMCDTVAFKVGCIFLIIFNGLGAVKAFLSQYMEVAEGVQRGGRASKFLAEIFGERN